MNKPPLNPDALHAASREVFREVLGFTKTQSTRVARRAVSAYLSAATPEIDADTLACKIMWKDLPFGGNPDNYIRLDANAAHAVIELLRPHLAALPAPRTITTVEEFINQRPGYITALQNTRGTDDQADYHRWQGGAEARRQLAQALGWTVPRNPGETTQPTGGGGE
ncbi:hypothetical protein [Glutamicibacter creatinolyticus]|uniref:hypothetical protein n=1 Tax=Glutamicibacter creatinolyticus TaxID=162496 RepID=UPI0031D47828